MAGICFCRITEQITEPSEHVVHEPVTVPFSLIRYVVCTVKHICRILTTELSEFTSGIQITVILRGELITQDAYDRIYVQCIFDITSHKFM